MRIVSSIAFSIALLGASGAPMAPAPKPPAQSASGQFIAFNERSAVLPPGLQGLLSNTNFISLEPTLLAVSCERIKQKLWDQLGMAAPWRGKVYLSLHTARSADELVGIVAERTPNGWNYSVALPDLLPRDRFLRAIVQVVLSEIANRDARAHAAEVPTWLVEGLCGELRASSEVELFLPPPPMNARGLAISRQIVNTRWSNPGELARQEFRSRPPLTFEQMSWPVAGQLAGEAGEVYGRSALLFVDSLLRLPDGPACLRTMLHELPGYYNWQLAFIQAFRSHFQTLLDVEKWWALQVVYLTGRGSFDRWTPDESLRKLAETIQTRVEIRAGESELPGRGEMNLQGIIREWDPARQARVLQRKLADLDLLRLRVAPDMMSLVNEYQGVIQTYLEKRGLSGPLAEKRLGGPVSDRLSQEAISRLDALDLRREAFRPGSSMED
jgi:hypothetical protein